jgi:hypothetical protein
VGIGIENVGIFLELPFLFSYVYVNIVKIVRNLKARRAKIKYYYYNQLE